MYATGFHVEDWNAPRPVEDALRDEITDAKNSFAVAKNIINALEYECDNHIKNLAQIRAELEAIKARRCEACKWFVWDDKGMRCTGDAPFLDFYPCPIEGVLSFSCEFFEKGPAQHALFWEPKDPQTTTSTETSDK